MKPLISIIIPVFNGENYMREAIDSALAQTYDNIEVLVVNDGSKDDGRTEQIALSYGDRIRYISKSNGGSSSALNAGIKNMNGDFFSWLSHDDLYMPDKIEKQIAAMSLVDPRNTVVVCRGELIDSDGNAMLSRVQREEGLFDSASALEHLSHGNGFNGCGILISKYLIERTGFFDEKMVYLNDIDYWWRLIMENVSVFYMPDKLVKTRIHGNQVSVTKRHLYDNERHYLAKKLLEQSQYAKMDQRTVLKQIAYFCAVENLSEEYRQVIRALSEKGSYNFMNALYFQMLWMIGYALNFMKWARKKIQFSR